MNKVCTILIFIVCAISYNKAYCQWEQIPGVANRIAASSDTTFAVWILGENNSVFKWNEDLFKWENFGGTAEEIAVELPDRPWVINDKQIYRLRKRVWQKMPGKAIDISSGGGDTWILGENGEAYKWREDLYSWLNYGGKADLIAIDSNGIPWVINNKQIYRLRSRNWQKMPGKATGIAGGGGEIWIIGENKQVYKWNEDGFKWENHGGQAYDIAVDGKGKPWIIDDNRNNRLIFRYQ